MLLYNNEQVFFWAHLHQEGSTKDGKMELKSIVSVLLEVIYDSSNMVINVLHYVLVSLIVKDVNAATVEQSNDV